MLSIVVLGIGIMLLIPIFVVYRLTANRPKRLSTTATAERKAALSMHN